MTTIQINDTTVEVDGVRYTRDAVKSHKPWMAKNGGRYYFITGVGGVLGVTEDDDPEDRFCYLTGNYFKTKEEAEAHKAYLEAIGRVTHRVHELNGEWVADWSKTNKCMIYYNHIKHMFFIDMWSAWQFPFILPYMSEQTAQQIIKEYEDDLKIIYGIK
jgi:hypothetical protein